MKNGITLLIFCFYCTVGLSQFAATQWEKTVGGSFYDYTKDSEPTFDGGFITIGYTESADGSVGSNHGAGDCWVLKFNAAGIIEWERTYGGTGFDYGYSIIQTADGGYAAVGYSESSDGDLTSNNGAGDCWIIKLDCLGNIEWQKVFGGLQQDNGQAIRQTMDGGYVVAGNTDSSDGDVTGSRGNGDCWILKLSYSGSLQWQKTIGGTSYDFAQNISVLPGGGYLFCGGTNSNDFDVALQKGNGDGWVVKLSNAGTVEWEHTFGGTEYDFAQNAIQTADGCFLLAGYTESNDGDVSGSHGGGDCWVLKFNASGSIIWQNSLGSSGNDYAYDISENSDGTYLMAGYSEFNDGDVTGNHGTYDCWIVNLSAGGDLIFQRSLGGSGLDIAYSVCRLISGSYIVTGYAQSDDGDVSANHGGGDGWIIKLNLMTTGVEEDQQDAVVSVFPNPGNGVFNFSGLQERSKLEIFDAAGKSVMLLESDSNFLTVDLVNEAPGIYFFRMIRSDSKVETGKFVLN